MPKASLETRQSCSVQKTAPKNTYTGEMTSFGKLAKIGHDAKAIGFAKSSFLLKN